MASPREPNPLRPYYNAYGTDEPASFRPTFQTNATAKTSSSNSLGTSARNILADIDYSDYVSDPSSGAQEAIKAFLEQMIWKYASVFLAQPFEVAKTVLQVHHPEAIAKAETKPYNDIERSRGRKSYDSDSSDSDADFPSYFTSSAPLPHTPTHAPRGRRRAQSPLSDGIPRVHPPRSPPRKSQCRTHRLELKSSTAVLSTLSSVWGFEGAWGIWKGSNCTFVHSLLLSTVTSFARSFLSALFALPDPGLSFVPTPAGPSSYAGGLDILNSTSPFSSLVVAISAAGIAGTLLAPLDIARTKLILTPCTHGPRSILSTLKSLPSWTLPWSIAPTSILHSILPTAISVSTPLFLRAKLGVDPVLTPNLFSVATFCSQALELCVKTPLETVLRRGQMALVQGAEQSEVSTVVNIGPYKGLFGTMKSIMYEEGERTVTRAEISRVHSAAGAKPKVVHHKRKGQGIEGLYRGYQVGMWGLIGIWGAATLGGIGSKGGEF